MSTSWAIGVSLLLLAANAFFVGAEFALISARRSVIEPRAIEGGQQARVTLKAMEQVSLMMACAQLGITICSLGLGYLGEPAIAHVLEGPFEQVGVPESLVHPIAFAIALSLIGFLHVVLGEMVPKNLALAAPRPGSARACPAAVRRGPRAASRHRAAQLDRQRHPSACRRDPKDEVTSAFTRDEVAGLVDESRREGLLDQHEGRLLVGALKFEERDARSVLLPPESLQTVAPDITPSQFEHVAARTGFSRFPVAAGGRFLGYLHLKDVLEFEDVHRNRPIARRWIRDLPIVRDSDRLRAVLATMQRSGAHLAQVADANGHILGVVALEDVVEELVGQIRDESGSKATQRQRAA
jgi:CBS domain containing-hemolysin-like protein